MKHSRLLLLSLYLSLPFVFSLRCRPQCPAGIFEDKNCNICEIVVSADCTTKETVRTPCTRCPVCAKAEGEKCGGRWGMEEKCASFLTCKYPTNRSYPKGHWTGVCVKTEKDDVKKFWELMKSLWNMIMNNFSGLFGQIGRSEK